MATVNPFDLLDDDAEDPTLVIAAQAQLLKEQASVPNKSPAQQAQSQPIKPPVKLPDKSLPVREARNDGQRGGVRGGPRGGARGRGRGFNQDSGGSGYNEDSGRRGFSQDSGGRGFNQEPGDDENAFGRKDALVRLYSAPQEGDKIKGGYGGPRGDFRGDRRSGFSNGDAAEGERPRRVYDRRSGTGRGNYIKREGSGRGNWGTPTDEIALVTEEPVNEGENTVESEKLAGPEDGGETKDSTAAEPEEKEPEEKEMTLEEYEKLTEEKRKALLALKPEERKVNLDKAFETMQLLSSKKNDDEIFVKLVSDKDKRKETVEKTKKTKSINEFLKPAEGESYYRPGGRGRGGRGRGRGGFGGNNSLDAGFAGNIVSAPSIQDVVQFPSLVAK